jgi:hypothetical protein
MGMVYCGWGRGQSGWGKGCAGWARGYSGWGNYKKLKVIDLIQNKIKI